MITFDGRRFARWGLSALTIGLVFSGCVSINDRDSFVGRPIAEAVTDLGVPQHVIDYDDGTRYFTWSTSDVILSDDGADNPANWTDPMTRLTAPEGLAMDRLESLPDYVVRPPFEPATCTLTLAASWDHKAGAWVARRAIRRGAEQNGHCGMRLVR